CKISLVAKSNRPMRGVRCGCWQMIWDRPKLHYSHPTLFQVQFVSRAITLNNRTADFLAARIKKECVHRSFRSGICEEVRCAVKIGSVLAAFAPRVQVRKSL